jgi:hypothetical protein
VLPPVHWYLPRESFFTGLDVLADFFHIKTKGNNVISHLSSIW